MTNKLRICLVGGQTLDMDPPVTFDMAQLVAAVRAQGYFLGPGIYIPHPSIFYMLLVDVEATAAQPVEMMTKQ